MGKINAKYELVALGVVEGKTLEQIAQDAGYRTKYAYSHVSRITRYPEVVERIRQLQRMAADASVMTALQRKIRLSELARDPNSDVCPVRCIHELNLMERIYRIGSDINIDQRVVNISVVSEASERATRLITQGIKTSLETDDDIDTSSEDEGEEKPISSLQASEI